MTPHGDLWIAGGTFDLENPMQSTELLEVDHKNHPDHWDHGPDLPEPSQGGCLININQCETAYIGGRTGSSSTEDRIFIYNWHEKLWTQGPTLNTARSNHECILLKDPEGERWKIVIAGEICISLNNASFGTF